MSIDQKLFTGINGFYWRHATNAEGEAIRKIIFAALLEHGLQPEPNITDKDLYDIEGHYKNHFFGVITNAEDKVEGTFALYNMGDAVAEIRKMYLPPEVRGLGLGKWMLSFLIEKARNEGYRKLVLETASSLQNAISLYQKFGFTQHCEENKSPRCDISMELVLDD